MTKQEFNQLFGGILFETLENPQLAEIIAADKKGQTEIEKKMRFLDRAVTEAYCWVNKSLNEGTDIEKLFNESGNNLIKSCYDRLNALRNEVNSLNKYPKLSKLVTDETKKLFEHVGREVENTDLNVTNIGEKLNGLEKYKVNKGHYFPDSQFEAGYGLGMKSKADKETDLQRDLFKHIPCATDVLQEHNHACYFLAPLRVIAEKHPEKLMDLIHDNGDGTVTVKFYPMSGIIGANDTGEKQEMLVTVDKTLPKIDTKSSPWVRLYEKAFAASKIVGASGYTPLEEDLNTKITIGDLSGGEPLISLSALDPSFAGSDTSRENANTMLSAMKNMDDVYNVLEKQIRDAKENGKLMCLCNGAHVITVTDIETNALGELCLKCYDQQYRLKTDVTLNDMLYEKTYDRFVMYDFGGQSQSHDASYFSLQDIKKSVDAHSNDEKYTVPDRANKWLKGMLSGEIKSQIQFVEEEQQEEIQAIEAINQEVKEEQEPEEVKFEEIQEQVQQEDKWIPDEQVLGIAYRELTRHIGVLSSTLGCRHSDYTMPEGLSENEKTAELLSLLQNDSMRLSKLKGEERQQMMATIDFALFDWRNGDYDEDVAVPIAVDRHRDYVTAEALYDHIAKQQDLNEKHYMEDLTDVEEIRVASMEDMIYHKLQSIGAIDDVFGHGKTYIEDYKYLVEPKTSYIKSEEKRNSLKNKISQINDEFMEGLFDEKVISKEELDYYKANHENFTPEAADKYFTQRYDELITAYAVQFHGSKEIESDPNLLSIDSTLAYDLIQKAKKLPEEVKREVKPEPEKVVQQPEVKYEPKFEAPKEEIKENNMPKDFQLFLYDAERFNIMYRKGSEESMEHWEPIKKAMKPLNAALSKISHEDSPQKIDVDSLYGMYQNALNAMDVAIKEAPKTETLKRLESFVKGAFSKEELKASADAYIADFKKPVDVDKLVKPVNPLKYSEDPLQKKMQQAALKLGFWNKYRNLYNYNDSVETINQAYDKCAKAIEDGTDENMRILNSIDKSKVEKVCDIVLSKGKVSSLIDFREYLPNREPLQEAELNTEQAFETFFNPKTSVAGNNFFKLPAERMQDFAVDADRKIHSTELPVPEGLEPNDVAMLTAAELLSDKVMSETYKKAVEKGGSTLYGSTDPIGGGRMLLTVNLLDGDERANSQYMRYGIADARANAKEVLAQYQSGNRKPMADVLLYSLIQNAKYQKEFMRVDDKAGAFYTKCISDTIALLDSDKFKDLVEIPQEVRDIDKLNKAHIKMTKEAAELKDKLNDYCLSKALSSDAQNPKDDPEFVNLYSKWYARTSHLDMVVSMAKSKRESGGYSSKDNEEAGLNRELTAYERKVIENADEYIRLREEFFLDSDAKKQLFEKDYASWKDVLSNKIKITQNAKVEPVTFDLKDQDCSNRLRFLAESIDGKKYPGVKEKLLAKAPLDGTKLSRDASKAELDFRAKQYDDFLNYYDSLNLDNIPSPFPQKFGLEDSGLRGDISINVTQFKKGTASINRTVADARKFEKTIGAFEKESNELQKQAEAKKVSLFTDEIARLSERLTKSENDKQKNSMSYKSMKITISDCVSNIKKIKTADDLKDVLNNLNESADEYLRDHANDKKGIFFTSCGKGRQERIKTCARIKAMKDLADRGIAYDSPEGKKMMLACKLVCAEKLAKGFSGFKALCQEGAIKAAIDAKLKDPVFNIVADKAIEKDADYDRLTKMSGGSCLSTYKKAASKIEKAIGKDKQQVKEQAAKPHIE